MYVPSAGTFIVPEYICLPPIASFLLVRGENGPDEFSETLHVTSFEPIFTLPYSLSIELRALDDDLGCSPFDYEAYPPQSISRLLL